MSDPRAEDRTSEDGKRPWYLPTQVMERIKLRLSPCDDGLPFSQAVRQKEEMDKAAAIYRKYRA